MRERAAMDSTAEFGQLQLRFVDQTQWRYEVIRPLVLFADRTATQRAHETATHPDTVRTFHRRFRQQGMLGLLPANVEVGRRERAGPVPLGAPRGVRVPLGAPDRSTDAMAPIPLDPPKACTAHA